MASLFPSRGKDHAPRAYAVPQDRPGEFPWERLALGTARRRADTRATKAVGEEVKAARAYEAHRRDVAEAPWHEFLPLGAEREAAAGAARFAADPAAAGRRAGERVLDGRREVRPPARRVLGPQRAPAMMARGHEEEAATRAEYQEEEGRTPGMFRHGGRSYGSESLGKPMELWTPLTETEVEERRAQHEWEEPSSEEMARRRKKRAKLLRGRTASARQSVLRGVSRSA